MCSAVPKFNNIISIISRQRTQSNAWRKKVEHVWNVSVACAGGKDDWNYNIDDVCALNSAQSPDEYLPPKYTRFYG